MAHLVGVDAAQMLPGRARVIDFVEIAGVHKGLAVRHELLLVTERRGLGADRQQGAVFIEHGNLQQLRVAAADQTQPLYRRDGRHAHGDLVPFENSDVVLVKIGDLDPVFPVGGDLDVVAAHAKSAVEQDPPRDRRFGEFDHGGLRHVLRCLRRHGIAQLPEGHKGIDKRQQHDKQALSAVGAVFFLRQPAGPQRRQQHVEHQDRQGQQDRKHIG